MKPIKYIAYTCVLLIFSLFIVGGYLWGLCSYFWKSGAVMAARSNKWIFETHDDLTQRLTALLSPRRRKKIKSALKEQEK